MDVDKHVYVCMYIHTYIIASSVVQPSSRPTKCKFAGSCEITTLSDRATTPVILDVRVRILVGHAFAG
jgi:hypothetical protein